MRRCFGAAVRCRGFKACELTQSATYGSRDLAMRANFCIFNLHVLFSYKNTYKNSHD